MNWMYAGMTHVVRETIEAADGPYSFFACGWLVTMETDGRAHLHGANTHEMTPTDGPPTCLWCVTRTER